MIKKECMTTEWIKSISIRNKYKDLNLIEKVIRAMSLLEMLKLSGCPFCFKGGSALMLILGESAHRLSIDIDIICPLGTDICNCAEKFPILKPMSGYFSFWKR